MLPINSKRINTLIFILILFWCIGILWEIVIHYFPSFFSFLPFLKYNYSIVCHTETEKLFSYGSYSTLTCSRCTGIYFGSLISSLLVLLSIKNKISTKMFLFSSIPMFIDVILYSFGFYNYSKIIALITGLLLGSIGFLYIHDLIIKLLIKKEGKN